MPEPAAAAPQPSTTGSENPVTSPRQCRYIKAGGEQCRNRAPMGDHYCHHHKYNIYPTLTGVKGYDRVLFLEDTTSIQLILSQLMQGLLDHTIESRTANSMFYGASIAASLVRHDFERERWLHATKQPIPESVIETETVDSQVLAPDQPYLGPTGNFKPQWSMSKYLYEQECEQAGKPTPQYASEFPPEGWLTAAEIEEQQTDDGARALMQRYEKKLAELKKHRAAIEAQETAAALAAGLPDPHARPKSTNPKCPFGITWCQGLRHHHHCGFCSGFTKMKISDARYPGDEAVARVATVREFLQEKKQKEESAGVPHPCSPVVGEKGGKEESQPAPSTTEPTPQPQLRVPHPCSPVVGEQGGKEDSQPTPTTTEPTPQPQLRVPHPCSPVVGEQGGKEDSQPAPTTTEPTPQPQLRVPHPCSPVVGEQGGKEDSQPTPTTTAEPTPGAPSWSRGDVPREKGGVAPSQPAAPQPHRAQRDPVEEWAFRPTSANAKEERASAPELPNWDDIPDPNFESEPDFDENGECWCGGPNQMFPCHVCRAKKESR